MERSRTYLVLLITAGVLVVLGVGIALAAPSGTFADDDGNVHEGNIEAIAAKGITKGCNPPTNDLYCPSKDLTRGQMAAFIRRALSLPASGTDFFTDDDASVFEGDINALAEAGITKGCNPPDNTLFCPEGKVRREVMAAFLRRAFNYPPSNVDFFFDDNGTLFEADINAIAAAGVTKGCNPPLNDQYCPTSLVKRDQMASFFARALGLKPVVPPTPTTSTTTTTTTVPPLTWDNGVLDSNGAVGPNVDMLLINDRLFAAYLDESNGDLKTAYCNDPDCISITYNWPEFEGGRAGAYASVALMPTGNPVIAYLHDSENEVRIAFCADVPCSSAAKVTLINDDEDEFDLGVAPDGTPALAYQFNKLANPFSGTPERHELHYLKCDDAACTTFTDSIVDGATQPSYVGEYPSLDFGVDGLPIISYYDRRSEDLKVAHCEDAQCLTATVTTLDAGASAGYETSIKILPDGTAGIAYRKGISAYFAKCTNVKCTNASITPLNVFGANYLDIAIRNGFPVISSADNGARQILVTVCESLDCTSKANYVVGTANPIYYFLGSTAIDVDSFGRIWVAYYNGTFAEVQIARSFIQY